MSYVSPAYGGSASDRQIVERLPLPKFCEPGSLIMVDKGFNVEDIFKDRGVTISNPTFFCKKNKLSDETLLKDRKVAGK